MKRTNKSHIGQYLKSSFANIGRAAGSGISEDRYDEDSLGPKMYESVRVRLPSDFLTPEERTALNGPVIVRTAKEAKK